MIRSTIFLAPLVLLAALAGANVPGGGSAGPDVKLTDNGTTVTLDNGIVTMTIDKAGATVKALSYKGTDLLVGGYTGGKFYWSWNMPAFGGPSNCTYTLISDPAKDSGNRAVVRLRMTWDKDTAKAAMDVDVHYALLRGSSGFYAAARIHHPASYPTNPGGEWRMSSYVGSRFDWLSVDAARNRRMPTPADVNAGTKPVDAPVEVKLLTQGPYAGEYECKYSYAADLGTTDAWGWSSTADNLGIWVTKPSLEYYNGGPLKTELMSHTGPTLLNMLGGGHYGMGGDWSMDAGQAFTKLYGPFLVYVNQVPSGTANAPIALWKDAVAQAKAEQAAWPYAWFKDSAYVNASGRGSVSGTIRITDPGSTASPESLWVGLVPPGVDFQAQAAGYQFWTRTNASGAFTLPKVRPGTYALRAFGKGAIGTFVQEDVVVKAGANPSLSLTWTPMRRAPTAWEIGVPDRDSREFRHGDDYNLWGTFKKFPTDFPSGLVYTVGKSDWKKDWNFVQPVITRYDSAGTATYDTYPFTVQFDRPAMTWGTKDSASLYLSFAGANYAALIVTLNGTNLSVPTTGFGIPNSGNAMIRLGSHSTWSDLRITFPAKLLKSGTNTLLLNQRKAAYGSAILHDYLRMEIPTASTETSPAREPRPGLRRTGDLIVGDGMHPLELLGPDGRVEKRAAVGQNLSIRGIAGGIRLVRCGDAVLPLAVPGGD